MTTYHKNLTGNDLHAINAWSYADASTILGASGFSAEDLGKIAWQQDNNTFWVLINHSPITWQALGDPPITSSVTYTIGSSGDYATINEALEDLSKKHPAYDNTGITVTLNLQAGYVMAEQVLVRGIDLGWITITGTDAETTITSSSLTVDFTTTDYGFASYPVFGVSKGGIGPVINQLFSFDVTGTDTTKHGILAIGAGSSIDISSGAGCKGADGINIYANRVSSIETNTAIATGAGVAGVFATNGSIINANSIDASGAGSYGIYAANGSTIGADGVDASGAGSYGIYARDVSTINADAANASGAGEIGIYAVYGSTINANGADCSDAGEYGIYASNASIIDAGNANASGATERCIYALRASTINANGADASGGAYGIYSSQGSTITAGGADATNSTSFAVHVGNGSIVNADGVDTTGSTTPFSKTVNDLTDNGIIYN